MMIEIEKCSVEEPFGPSWPYINAVEKHEIISERNEDATPRTPECEIQNF